MVQPMNDFVRMWRGIVSLRAVVLPLWSSHGLCDCFADFPVPLVLNHDAHHPVATMKIFKRFNN